MSKNLIVLFIIILLIVGGFAIYTYDQSNQAKIEVEEKNLKLETSDELISELKKSIKEKELQIDENLNLDKEKKVIEQEYSDKLSQLTAEKAKLEGQLAEKKETTETSITASKEIKDNLEKIIAEREKIIAELSESIKKYEEQIKETKEQMVKEGKDKEQEYSDKLSQLTAEKAKLEGQLAEKKETTETSITASKEIKDNLEKIIAEREKIIAELSESIKKYEEQIKETKEQMVKEGKDKEEEFTVKLSALTAEKSKVEGQLAEREEAIKKINKQKSESAKIILSKDNLILELKRDIEKKESEVSKLREDLVKEKKDLEQKFTRELVALKEEKAKLEAKLAELIEKNKPNYYEVKKGDCLWKIAGKFYNKGDKWIRIFEANMEKINNPDLIYPYQRFTIPKE